MEASMPKPFAFTYMKFDIQPTDRVRIRDKYYKLRTSLKGCYLFRTDDDACRTEYFGDAEFYHLVCSGEAEIDHLYYSERRAELRASVGSTKLEDFNEIVEQGEFYADLIDLFENSRQ